MGETDHEGKTIESCKQKLKNVCRLLLADEIPQGERVDVLFLNGRAIGDTSLPGRPGNDESGLFEYVSKLYREGKFKDILLPGSDGQNWAKDISVKSRYMAGIDKQKAWSGRSEFLRKLSLACDIDLANIFFSRVEVGTTRDENVMVADELILHSEWRRLALVCHPHHVFRNFAGQLNENRKRGLVLKIYSAHPGKTDWEERVGGSQGKNQLPRKDHALLEMQRVVRYSTEDKNLATVDEILEYLKWRDGGSLSKLESLLAQKMQGSEFRRDLEVMEDAINMLTVQEIEKLTNLQN